MAAPIVFAMTLAMILSSTGCKSTGTGDKSHPGTIAGQVGKPGVSGATVFICNAQSGLPLGMASNIANFPRTVTDAKGRFSFTNIPPGSYRLIAQSWPDSADFKRETALNIPTARTLQVLGTAEQIEVPSKAATRIRILPLGTGKLTLDQNFPNNEGYVLISTKALTADPILGFLGWNEEFLNHAIGIGAIPMQQAITISGLPSRNIQAAIFANDNSPGFGSAFFSELPSTAQKIPIVAGWSDAQHEPPAKIKHIMDVLDAHKTNAGELLKVRRPQARDYAAQLKELREQLGSLDRMVALPNGEQATVADVFATIGYKQLLQRDQTRPR